MSLEADSIVDRRRLRRKLAFWRAWGILFVLIAAVAIVALLAPPGSGLSARVNDYVARVTLTGLIRDDKNRVEALDKLAKSSVKAVIVHLDSPGGTTTGAEQLFKSLRRVVASKPTVMVVDGLAASGGYIAAIAGDHVVAPDTSLVGSIGVLFQYPNFADLLKTVGVKVEEVKSSPLKAAPNGYEPTSPEARAAIEAVVRDSYDWFRGLVKERRRLDDAALERVADGRVFTGRQGVEVKLVDELGNDQTAVAWLAKEKGVDANLPVRDWHIKGRLGDLSFLHLAAVTVLDAVGLKSLARRVENSAAMQA